MIGKRSFRAAGYDTDPGADIHPAQANNPAMTEGTSPAVKLVLQLAGRDSLPAEKFRYRLKNQALGPGRPPQFLDLVVAL